MTHNTSRHQKLSTYHSWLSRSGIQQ